MQDVRNLVDDVGMYASTLREPLGTAVKRRYRPINADDDVVELAGSAYDRLLWQLAELGELMQQLSRELGSA